MRTVSLVVTVLLALPGAALARNVDLVTLPPRDTVALTIYNSEDLTLVKETRAVTFKKGRNRLQFSWANTRIDPTSVYFRPLERADAIEVLTTTFPADRPHVLVWDVESEIEGQVRVEVSYFTSGISWAADYVMVTDPDETAMDFDGYVTVTNHSGEDYDGAQVRLMVGVVNLVEKIAELAEAGGGAGSGGWDYDKSRRRDLYRGAIRYFDDLTLGNEVVAMNGAGATFGAFEAAPEVVKEALSEYFIFTVEGRHRVPSGWAKRLVSFRTDDVPFEIVYRYRPHQYGDRPVRFFILANDVAHDLGESPLPEGVIRVFRRNERAGLAYCTTQTTKYVPLREKIELNVGTDPRIVYERSVRDVARSAFRFDETQRVPPVVGWEERLTWREEIRNYRAKPITMEIRHQIGGDVRFRLDDAPRLFDFRTVEYTTTVAPRGRKRLESEGLFRRGTSQRQNRVRLAE